MEHVDEAADAVNTPRGISSGDERLHDVTNTQSSQGHREGSIVRSARRSSEELGPEDEDRAVSEASDIGAVHHGRRTRP